MKREEVEGVRGEEVPSSWRIAGGGEEGLAAGSHNHLFTSGSAFGSMRREEMRTEEEVIVGTRRTKREKLKER